MADLNMLPPEIVEMIVSSVYHQSTLASLSRVCKGFHKLVQPHLYRSINFSWVETSIAGGTQYLQDPRMEDTEEIALPAHSDLPVHNLLDVLLARPDLASLVQRISFQGWDDRAIWSIKAEKLVEAAKLLPELVNPVDLAEFNRWKLALAMAKVDVYAALLVSKLQDLRTLELTFIHRSNGTLITNMFKHLVIESTPPRFPRLRRVKFAAEQTPKTTPPLVADFPLDSILPFFYLPNIEEIEMVSVAQSHWEEMDQPDRIVWPTRSPPTASTLKTLVIRKSSLKYTTLESLLAVCPGLETLTFERLLNGRRAIRNLMASVGVISSSLRQVRHTLKNLTLNFVEGRISDENLELPFDPIRSLHEFPVLETLVIPVALLLDRGEHRFSPWPPLKDVLPDTLQSLTLICYAFAQGWPRDRCLKVVQKVMREAESRPVRLRHLGLNVCSSMSSLGEFDQSWLSLLVMSSIEQDSEKSGIGWILTQKTYWP